MVVHFSMCIKIRFLMLRVAVELRRKMLVKRFKGKVPNIYFKILIGTLVRPKTQLKHHQGKNQKNLNTPPFNQDKQRISPSIKTTTKMRHSPMYQVAIEIILVTLMVKELEIVVHLGLVGNRRVLILVLLGVS